MARVQTSRGWVALPADNPPEVDESKPLAIDGLHPGAVLRIGPVHERADGSGRVQLRPAEHSQLRGHIGLVPVFLAEPGDGAEAGERLLGEVRIRPDKMSEEAYQVLRADLERVWTGLLFDPSGISSLEATLPGADELWHRIEGPVQDILLTPRTHLISGPCRRRLETVRRPRELTPALMRAAGAGRPGASRTTTRTVAIPENALVAATLRRLLSWARRDSEGTEVATTLARILRREPFRSCGKPPNVLPWGTRSDVRYQRVEQVRRLLDRPETLVTEGPGEVRLGVQGLSRLYEYWVFLQVLMAAEQRYGPPTGDGYRSLAVSTTLGGHRLELPAGTTVTFPGPVHVAFEPAIMTSGSGWMGLELVPHPDGNRFQATVTPDVVVYRRDEAPWVTVIDAKYVGRHWVLAEATEIHAKYARMRADGRPVVRHVMAAHPHGGLNEMWAGFGSVGLVPGEPTPPLPLPPPTRPATESAPTRPPEPSRPGSKPAAMGGVDPDDRPGTILATARPTSVDLPDHGPPVVVADQRWMRQALGSTRIDIRRLAQIAAGGPFLRAVLISPRIPGLEGFTAAARGRGWEIWPFDLTSRRSSIDACLDAVRSLADDEPVVLVTGDPFLIETIKAEIGARLRSFDQLDEVPRY